MKNKTISKEWILLFRNFNELQKRCAAAIKAEEIGFGGTAEVIRATGIDRNTITKGKSDLKNFNNAINKNRIRSPGGGRKSTARLDIPIIFEVEKILEETTGGDPMKALIWTSKSTRKITAEINRKGLKVSKSSVYKIMIDLGFSLQSNRKTLSKKDNPDRNAQFEIINDSILSFMKGNMPVISVDAKKRELIGNFKNAGSSWNKSGKPKKVLTYDYPSDADGIAIPYGSYDIARNEGFINVGISGNTAEFAVNSIEQWWTRYGTKHYPKAKKLLICADGGGSNGSTNRLWKKLLQELANKYNISVCIKHYPPGASKWNKIEHRMFSQISLNWKGKPLEDYKTVINLISNTTTKTGLKVDAKLDCKKYETGIKVSDEVFKSISVGYSDVFPKWNYEISPQ